MEVEESDKKKNYVLYILKNVSKCLFIASCPQFQECHCRFICRLLRNPSPQIKEPWVGIFLNSLMEISFLSSMFNEST